jgi:hypothetical protein
MVAMATGSSKEMMKVSVVDGRPAWMPGLKPAMR